MKRVLLLILLLASTACAERAVDEPAATSPPPAAPAQPEVAATTTPAMGAMPAPGAIGFAGFGPAPFGANEEQVRMAWGKDLGEDRPEQPGGCYYLLPQPRTGKGFRIGFMLEGDRFVRIDVDAADIVAPGGGKVGMSVQDINRLYAGRVTQQNHKYVQGGHYLRIGDAGGGRGALLFETDEGGRVTAWRVGVPPQVDYVEGCS